MSRTATQRGSGGGGGPRSARSPSPSARVSPSPSSSARVDDRETAALISHLKENGLHAALSQARKNVGYMFAFLQYYTIMEFTQQEQRLLLSAGVSGASRIWASLSRPGTKVRAISQQANSLLSSVPNTSRAVLICYSSLAIVPFLLARSTLTHGIHGIRAQLRRRAPGQAERNAVRRRAA